MNRFVALNSLVVLLPADDVDTDQIIPARFLKGTAKHGLGANLFADWRAQPDFPLNDGRVREAKILVAGNNFGCGSSREHAPWALYDWGFRAIIARSFADIFRQNATKNGLLPVALDDAACARIEAAARTNPSLVVHVDLPEQRVTLPDGAAFTFDIDPFQKHCLIQGRDELGYILSFEAQIAEHERRAV